jgi:hypothetical protein
MDESRLDEVDKRPPARFQQFERVIVTDTRGQRHEGTILWRDLVTYRPFGSPSYQGPPQQWSQWEYAVELPDFACCPTLKEERLEATGEFASEDAHLGTRFEMSFDTGLEDDNRVVEGTYRVPGQFWQVFLFHKGTEHGKPVSELRHRSGTWPSGITGMEFDVPDDAVLDRAYMIQAFSSVFGTCDWVEVRGPDSLLMK